MYIRRKPSSHALAHVTCHLFTCHRSVHTTVARHKEKVGIIDNSSPTSQPIRRARVHLWYRAPQQHHHHHPSQRLLVLIAEKRLTWTHHHYLPMTRMFVCALTHALAA